MLSMYNQLSTSPRMKGIVICDSSVGKLFLGDKYSRFKYFIVLF